MSALTLRLPDALHERYRVAAFHQRTSMTALMVAALERGAPHVPGGCDQCGAVPARLTTPGAIRLCAAHDSRSPAVEGAEGA